jgi:secreted trypsin-like serine protease
VKPATILIEAREPRSAPKLTIFPLAIVALLMAMGVFVPSGLAADRDSRVPVPRITGGQPVEDGRLPWLASLVDTSVSKTRGFFCTGSLVQAQWVLTAGHCLKRVLDPDAEFRIGLRSLELESATYFRATTAHRHPGWGLQGSRYDAALIRLETPVYDITPVALPTSEDRGRWQPGKKVIAAGWGQDEFRQIPNRANQVALRLYGGSVCGWWWNYRRKQYWPGQMLCGYGRQGRDTCSGDSGGPMIGGWGADARLLGLTSYGGRRCGTVGVPSVYTRVTALQPWLGDVIQGFTYGYPSAPIPW